ncbi:hypothetical protein GCM10011351_17870 [Paraliobacillus quinghaiensis]|uniref:PilZ domain-containing protein n=1 Tax=Paraliobacillus quinghaiensis TaxID=470815 RepID=A0A917TPK6_9BACI|nr:PilZ domain-containing protein [Paraliobacillus quinghaiensis]GGM32146.1 hypothetical protein GCM10011351_17870 [Paraliobacillus quinghaiensis]
MPRMYARAHFSNPPVINASIQVADGSCLLQKDSKIVIHNIGLQGLRFSSMTAFSVGDTIKLQVSLFSPTNRICGEIIWKKEDPDTYHYGLKIITSDYDFFQFMHSYDTYINEHQYAPQ